MWRNIGCWASDAGEDGDRTAVPASLMSVLRAGIFMAILYPESCVLTYHIAKWHGSWLEMMQGEISQRIELLVNLNLPFVRLGVNVIHPLHPSAQPPPSFFVLQLELSQISIFYAFLAVDTYV
jgi:hypothetical protein